MTEPTMKARTEAAPDDGAQQVPSVCDADLVALLEKEPLLCARLKEALVAGRWLITVHRKVRDTPPDDLLAHAMHRDFPLMDLTDSMQGICRQVLTDAASQLEGQQQGVRDSRAWR